jgi:protein-tyrosine kinase
MSKIFDALKRAEREGRDERPEDMGHDLTALEGSLEEEERPRAENGDVEPGLDLPNLLNTLETRLKDRSDRVILFCSSLPGEGVTTVLTDFAHTVSRLREERVLLVGADPNGADLSRAWRLPPSPGLSDALLGRKGPEDCIRETDVHNVFVLPAGGDLEVQGRALGSERMHRLIQLARRGFPYVLVDGGAVLTNAETPRLGRAADGAVLVIRTAETKREFVRRAIDELSRMEIPILGLILNRKKQFIPRILLEHL